MSGCPQGCGSAFRVWGGARLGAVTGTPQFPPRRQCFDLWHTPDGAPDTGSTSPPTSPEEAE